MGSPEFAVPSLERLHHSHHEILAVATNADKRRGRGGDLQPTAVKKKAKEFGYSVIDVDSVTDAGFQAALERLDPDLFVVVAFRILPAKLLTIPSAGAVNLHASLLPKYRGAAPIHWAVINGEPETGCSVFFLEEKVDTGAVIRQVRTRIGPNETTGDLYHRLKMMGADLLVESLDLIEKDRVEGVPQDESAASRAPKLFRDDARVNFRKSSQEVHNFIRGMSPSPCAWANYGNLQLKLYRSKAGPDIELDPGELLFAEGRYLLAGCSRGSVELTELQLPGKPKISGRDFANGYNLDKGLK